MDTNMPRQALVSATPDDELIRILGQSLYPGAKPESIRLVLAWCKATGRDPMKKPIHIVPMRVKDPNTGKWDYRDTLMPGIGTYRSDAVTTGQYAGLSEPEYGPDIRGDVDGCELTYPQWCKITVYRIVGGEARPFPAKELWLENYASGEAGKGVNAMWRKRPYAQLAKVAEAQALRKAFPDETGQTNTTDELEGKTFAGETIDVTADEPKREQHRPKSYATNHETGETSQQTGEEVERISAFMAQVDTQLRGTKDGSAAFKILKRACEQAPTLDDLAALQAHPFREVVRGFKQPLPEIIDDAFALAGKRLAPSTEETSEPGWNTPNDGESDTKHDLEGNGTNHTRAEASTTEDAVKTVADALKADKPEGDTEWMPGDP